MNEKIKEIATSNLMTFMPFILAVIAFFYSLFSGADGSHIFSSTFGTLSLSTVVVSYLNV